MSHSINPTKWQTLFDRVSCLPNKSSRSVNGSLPSVRTAQGRPGQGRQGGRAPSWSRSREGGRESRDNPPSSRPTCPLHSLRLRWAGPTKPLVVPVSLFFGLFLVLQVPPPRSSVETECAALKVACLQCKGAKALSLSAAALGPKGVRFEIKGSLLVQRLSG